MLRSKWIFAVLFLSTLPLSAHADMIWSDAYKNPMSNWGAYMYDQNVKRHLRQGAVRSSGTTSTTATVTTNSATASAPPAAPITATDFQRDPNGQDVVAQFIASSNLPPADGAKLAEALRPMVTQLNAGIRKDNVANGMTLLIGMSYGVLERPDFDIKKADDLIPVVNNALAASPQFVSLGAAQRQQMYDSMLLSSAIIAIIHQSGDKQASKAIATQALQQLGLPI